MQDTGSSHPLIVMLHGFGNDKHEWESTTDEGDGADKYHWNNRWFARHGYYVLNYTARGFRDDGPSEDHEPPTPADPNGSADPAHRARPPPEEPRLGDPRHAVARRARRRDVPRRRPGPGRGDRRLLRRHRELAPGEPADLDLPALAVDGDASGAEPPGRRARSTPPPTSRTRSAPNGHGGGPALRRPLRVLAGDARTTTRATATRSACRRRATSTALFALGADEGRVREGPVDGRALPVHVRRTARAGHHPVMADAHRRRGPDDPRGPDHPPGPARPHRVPRRLLPGRGLGAAGRRAQGGGLLDPGLDRRPVPRRSSRSACSSSSSGWTRAGRWRWRSATWATRARRTSRAPGSRLNAQAFQWLESNINRSHEQQTTVSSETTVCGDRGPPQRVVGRTPEDLANGALTLQYQPAATRATPRSRMRTARPPTRSPDRIVQPGEPCRHSAGPAVGGYSDRTRRRSRARETYVGLGHRAGPVCLDRRWKRHARGAPVRPRPGRDGAAHDARRLPLRERPARRRDPAPAVRKPLAPRARAPDPARPDPGRQPDVPARATSRARSGSRAA